MNRVIAAYLLAPLVAALWVGLCMLLYFLFPIPRDGWGWISIFHDAFGIAVAVFILSFATILLVGIPAFFVFKKLGWYDKKYIIILSSLIAALWGGMLITSTDGALALFAVLVVTAGAVAGFAFWWIGVRNNPWVIEKFEKQYA